MKLFSAMDRVRQFLGEEVTGSNGKLFCAPCVKRVFQELRPFSLAKLPGSPRAFSSGQVYDCCVYYTRSRFTDVGLFVVTDPFPRGALKAVCHRKPSSEPLFRKLTHTIHRRKECRVVVASSSLGTFARSSNLALGVSYSRVGSDRLAFLRAGWAWGG